jgi:uncharacterized protein
MLYLSPYNVVIHQEGIALLFNTYSLQFGRIDETLYRKTLSVIDAINARQISFPIDEEVKRIVFELRQKGFLVDDPAQVQSEVMSRFNRHNGQSDHFVLTIAPTDACNFACPYCYEDPNCTYMSEKTQRYISAFIENNLAEGKYRSMHVTWYGGEPLMPKSLQAIEYLSERIIDICSKLDISYSAHIISNAYLLNQALAQRLVKWKVELMQVTLDGPRELHNTTRVLKNGAGTFDRILENIKSCSELLRFNIRMNVTAENASSVAKLKRILCDEGILNNTKRSSFYISPVRSYTKTCQSSSCLSNELFYRLQLDLLRNGINDDGFEVVEEYPASKYSVCVTSRKSFVIGPDGRLYKCWLDFGRHELAVGLISESLFSLNENITKWQTYSPFNRASCATCTMLPVCMGGCPELNMRSFGQEENQACCNWKYFLHEHLLFLAEQINWLNTKYVQPIVPAVKPLN